MTTTQAVRRTTQLARSNAVLMVRNRLTLIYAFVLPLSALLVLVPVRGGGDEVAISPSATAVLMALLFPVYYSVLSMFVTRRDELVLKRLRTSEARDLELVVSMALPGVVITVATTVVAAVVVALMGWSWPANPVLLLVGVLVATASFAALAVWTASWTQNAEAAQLTSAPVLVLAIAGTLLPLFPDDWHRWIDLTPGAAVLRLVEVSWFAREPGTGDTLTMLGTWWPSVQPLVVLVAWTVLSVSLARRSLRWEPRA
jgi:ABC-2 type transport system permease protein